MYCYECGDRILAGEAFCRNCGTQAAAIATSEPKLNLAAAFGYFSIGFLVFAIISYVILAASVQWHLPPFFVLLVVSLLGGCVSGAAFYLLSRNRELKHLIAGKNVNRFADSDQLTAGNTVFITPPESVTVSTTSKLRVPRTD